METTTPKTLPEDIQEEILKRLPVRNLLRFSCVCKSWRRLFTNPSFASTHLRLHSSTRIILSRHFKAPLSISIPSNSSIPAAQQLHLSLLDGSTYSVKGHCHGLLCLVVSDGTILLWNPAIRHRKTLPSPPNFMGTREVLGIGFDPSVNNYKVIRFPSAYCKSKVKDYHPQVEVFTLGSNSWRKLPDEDTPPCFVEHYQQSVALSGAVYWLALYNHSPVILRFDLAEEKFSVVPPPDYASMNLSWVGVLKDLLCVIHADRGHHFDVWAMRDDPNWEKMVTVSEIIDPGLEPSLSTVDYVPLCFVESGELIMSVRGKGLVAYDPERGRYRKVAAMEDDARWLQETAYTDTLVSPHGYGGGGDDNDDDDGQLLQQQQGSSIGFARNLWEMLVGHWWRGSATK